MISSCCIFCKANIAWRVCTIFLSCFGGGAFDDTAKLGFGQWIGKRCNVSCRRFGRKGLA